MPIRESRLFVLACHEGISKFQVEVGLVGQDICESTQIHIATGVFIQMGVGCDGEDKRAARGTLRMKGVNRGFDALGCSFDLILPSVAVPSARV